MHEMRCPKEGAITVSIGFRMLYQIPIGTDFRRASMSNSPCRTPESGMSEEVQSQLFQPFFTTKPKGRGTGLGLATCAVIVKSSQGAIHFTSRVGEGTTF